MRDTGTEGEAVSEWRASANERGVAGEGVGVGAAGVGANGKSGTVGNGGKLPEPKPAAENSVCGESWRVVAALAEDDMAWPSVGVVVPLVESAAPRAAREYGVGEAIFGPARPLRQLPTMLSC